ncbi:FtsX-like permease family protein [Dactylosporangium salmoneum]|uniref:ABC3 transporter permease C-terminal domain-containing protein n=1 Tax=Dactylosporangium salmoneum TaxID=53361 RepID=A0ABN3FMM9_9ACTN
MRPGTLLRLGLAGSRLDTVRVGLTALSTALATLAVLAAANVVAIGPLTLHGVGSNEWAEQYSNALLREPGLRPGVVLTLLLLTIPVFALAGQCARLGAPARDRRLAAIRLAGATPAQTVAVAAAETGVADLAGWLAGLAALLAGRDLLGHPDAEGRLPLPTDVRPPAWLLVLAVVAVPALAALAAAVAMRRVTVGPLGVVRRARRTTGPRPWPGLLVPAGMAAFAVGGAVPRLWVLLLAGAAATGLGIVLGTGWLTHVCGRVLQRRARRASTTLAAARLVSDPWSGSRTLAVLLICVLFGAGAAGVRAYLLAEVSLRQEADPFYARTMDLIDAAILVAVALTAIAMIVVVAEGVASRRREYAALVATGVPRATLAGSILWQTLLPAVPAILLAVLAGLGLSRTLGTRATVDTSGSYTCVSDTPQTQVCRPTTTPVRSVPVPIPWPELARDAAAGVGAVLVTTGAGLLLLRRSVDVEELRAA